MNNVKLRGITALIKRLRQLLDEDRAEVYAKPFPITLTGQEWLKIMSAVHMVGEHLGDTQLLGLAAEVENQFDINLTSRIKHESNKLKKV
jgi:hypothetical protein